MKRLLLTTAALLPLAAGQAQAETKISTATTTPVRTSTAASGAPDAVTVEAAGSIKPTASGAAITVDSDHKVKSAGELGFNNVSNATGVRIQGGRTTEVANTGAIRLLEDFTATDADKDGDLDGALAQGTARYGVRATGPGLVTGPITNGKAGTIVIEGNSSAGVLIESDLKGDLTNAGAITVTGNDSVGLAANRVDGAVRVTGAVNVQGANAEAVRLGDVTGVVQIQGGVAATGYRSAARPADTSKLDADDLLQGGAAVRLTGNLGGGLILDARPADKDPAKSDEDSDGTPDAEEGTALVQSVGGAPAIDLGGAGATTVAAVAGQGYGIVIKGEARGSGLYDGVAATGVRIGQAGGGAVSVAGGLLLDGGTINAAATKADSTALRLNAGATVPELKASGTVRAISTGGAAHTATAVYVDQGAELFAIRNSGLIAAEAAGAHGAATAILDRSGELGLIENTGAIRAVGAAGKATAIDLSARTEGAVIRQTAPTATGPAEPTIVGDVRLGSGDDLIELNKGSVEGELSFGAGLDRFVVDGGRFVGTLKDADETLDFEVKSGVAVLDGDETTTVGSLTLRAGSTLVVAADGATGEVSGVTATGAAVVEAGAKIELHLTSLTFEPRSFRVLGAANLSYAGAGASLIGAPFLYVAELRPETADGELFADVRRRTAAEIGLNRSGAAAYDAVTAQLATDDRIEAAVLSADDQASLTGLYDQMLPDHSGGALLSAAAASRAISSAVNQRSRLGEQGPTAIWVEQIHFDLEQDRDLAQGTDSQGFGLAAGLEEIGANDDAWGVSASFVSAKYKDQGVPSDERVVMSFLQAGLYARKAFGDFRLDGRVGAGVAKFDGQRRLLSPGLNLKTAADRDGWLVDARLGAAYDARFGLFTVRPELALDYVRLSEDGYEEQGGGAGFDLVVDEREGDLLTGTAAVTLGARFGGEASAWGPELTVGWRERLSGDAGRTTARFRGATGPSFTLLPEDFPAGGVIYELSFKGEYGRTLFAFEAGGESGDAYSELDARLFVKFAF